MRAAAAAALAAAAVLAGSVPAAGEVIRRFETRIDLSPGASYGVLERIVYDFEGEQRHGIFRDLPVRYERPGLDHHIGLEVLEVTDAGGRTRPSRTRDQDGWRRIRIGDPDRKLTGVQEYRIRYRVTGGALFFEDHDELYWNATGTGWQVPIEAVQAEVSLPPEWRDAELDLACFTGPQGARESDCQTRRTASGAAFRATRPLGPREGLTVVVGLPKGLLAEPSAAEQLWRQYAGIAGAAAVPLLALAGMLGLWRRSGRDPGAGRAIPVRYEPPEGLTPAEVGTLIDERADLDDVTSTILDLAVRGYLRIHEIESASFLFFSSKDYELERLGQPGDLAPHEAKLFAGLFADGDRVRISSLKNRFYTKLPGITKALYARLSGPRRHFPASPERVRKLWGAGGVVLLVLAAAGGASGVLGTPLAVGLGLAGAIVAAFSRVMPRKTRRGRRAHDEILGFREFLERVDRDRLERMGTRTTEVFERLLPYAVVLGVADAWADAFADLYSEPPSWYVGPGHGGSFRPRAFVGDVGQSLHTMGQSLASSPRGSGSSGLGGGGFSGGGFGGGGGGSW